MRTRASEQSRSQVNARSERSRVGVSVCMIWRMCLSRSGVFVCVDCLEISSVQFYMNVHTLNAKNQELLAKIEF